MPNIIQVKGGAYTDVKKALNQWTNLYAQALTPEMPFEIYKNGRANHIIKAPSYLSNMLFYFLVNYLEYPEDINYKVKATGYTVGKEDNELKGKRLMVYISDTDHEHDNVFMVTSDNETFKMDFKEVLTHQNIQRPFERLPAISLEHPETIIPKEIENVNPFELPDNKKVFKRFKVLSVVSLIAMGMMVILSTDHELFEVLHFFMAYMLWAWFFIDYKMLQHLSLYVGAWGLTTVLYLTGFALGFGDSTQNTPWADEFVVFIPIWFLIAQFPFRMFFIWAIGREPVVDRPAPTFWDGVYILSLMFISFFVPLYLIF